MLTTNENERLTQVGPGTPMGELFRRYWHPIAATGELAERPTKSIRLLGEDLVLYKDRSGTYGLIDALCPHRRVDLSYGIPEEQGLRCMYHGWMFDETGQCVEQPFEETVHPSRVSRPGAEPGSREAVDKAGGFKEKVKTKAYPVEELGGVLLAYMGPAPAPLVPRWDLFVMDNVVRDVGVTVLPCNWLQCMENSLDPVHVEWLHAYYTNALLDPNGRADIPQRPQLEPWRVRQHGTISFDLFEHGIIKRRTFKASPGDAGTTTADPEWTSGHPIIFPNILRVGSSFEYRVPMDDTHTLHLVFSVYAMPPGVTAPTQETVPYYDVPAVAEDGTCIVDYTLGQDMMAWATQGPIARRELEKLGQSDVGIILFRKLLHEQMAHVERGEDVMNTFRDAEANSMLALFQEYAPGGEVNRANLWVRQASQYSPMVPLVDKIYEEAIG
jgi:5,5'-dehydrodivanillate O-demethylase oxygenase subunit